VRTDGTIFVFVDGYPIASREHSINLVALFGIKAEVFFHKEVVVSFRGSIKHDVNHDMVMHFPCICTP